MNRHSMLVLLTLVANFRPIHTFDAPHTLNKFSKYLELIDTKRVAFSKPAQKQPGDSKPRPTVKGP